VTDLDILLDRLFDDASLFPPAKLPLDQAVAGHLIHRAAGHAAAVGPLVVGVDHLPRVPAATDVAVTGQVGALATALQGAPSARVAWIEASGALPEVLDLLRDRPGYAEIDLRRRTADVLDDVLDASAAGVAVKFRAGGVTASAFPTEAELAVALRACAVHSLPFKLTAGLHGAARHRDAVTGFEHHGLLNVVLAVDAAQRGASDDEVAGVLGEHDERALADAVLGLPPQRVTAIRTAFRSVGTCSVEESLTALADAGLQVGEHVP